MEPLWRHGKLMWRCDDDRNGTIHKTLRSISSVPENQLMKTPLNITRLSGKIGWALLWLIGIPVPILLVLFAIRGCT
jgi:hypothetical protein